MAITVIKKTETIEQYHLDATDFSPCCESWQKEFGLSIIISPDKSGVLPDNLLQRKTILGKIKYRQLILPWSCCPFCGAKIVYDLQENGKKTTIEPTLASGTK